MYGGKELEVEVEETQSFPPSPSPSLPCYQQHSPRVIPVSFVVVFDEFTQEEVELVTAQAAVEWFVHLPLVEEDLREGGREGEREGPYFESRCDRGEARVHGRELAQEGDGRVIWRGDAYVHLQL